MFVATDSAGFADKLNEVRHLLTEISNIAYNMRQAPAGHDAQFEFGRVYERAERARHLLGTKPNPLHTYLGENGNGRMAGY